MVFVPSNWQPTGSYGMGAAVADFDNDGWPDIYVACDTAPSLLYRNNHDGTFREIAGPAGCAFDGEGAALAGMGVGVGDFDADGWLDIVRTNFSEQVTTLYRNYGGGAFEDASIRAGLGVNRKYLGFGVDFFDFDNDGWADIFIANGHVYSQIANKKLHLKYREPKVLYRNLGNGRFEDVSAKAGPAILAENLGRGCAFGDFDNDGDVDVIVNNLDGPPTLLRNDGGSGNGSILVKCVGTKSNRSAIGARVRVTSGEHAQMREVMSGSSYYSQSDLRLHFGLGAAAAADSVEVAWPSGLKETFKDLPARPPLRRPGDEGDRRQASARDDAAMALSALLLRRRRPVARGEVHRGRAVGRDRLQARELGHLEQVPARDHGRRRRPLRLRPGRPAGRLLHERRAARGSHARGEAARQVGPSLLEPPLPPEARTAPSPTSRRRRASPGCRRTATAWGRR